MRAPHLTEREQMLRYCEEQFAHAGLPLLNERQPPLERSMTKGLWLVVAIFTIEVLAELDWGGTLLANLGVLAAALGARIVAVAALNRYRGQRLLSIPQSLGLAEAAVFVGLPPLLSLVFGAPIELAVGVAALNAVLVLLIFVFYGFGTPEILRWVARHALDELSGSLTLLGRAVPLLLFFAFVLFLTTEIWQVFAELPRVSFVLAGVMFAAMATAFLSARLPVEVRAMEEDHLDIPLTPNQRVNVGLVFFTSQALQVMIVSLLIGIFFVALGVILLPVETIAAWSGHQPSEILAFTLDGHRFSLTDELMVVSVAIATFSGLYFTISVLTDESYRQEFLEESYEELRGLFRLRADYKRLLAQSESEPSPRLDSPELDSIGERG